MSRILLTPALELMSNLTNDFMSDNNFKLSPDYHQILDAADRYAREELHPLWQKMDEQDWYPEHIMTQLGSDGWLGITVPEELAYPSRVSLLLPKPNTKNYQRRLLHHAFGAPPYDLA